MTKKIAVVAIEFDDPEENFEILSDLALYLEARLKLKDLDVTAYPTPEALSLDTAEGLGIFAAGRTDAGIPIPQSVEAPSAPKP